MSLNENPIRQTRGSTSNLSMLAATQSAIYVDDAEAKDSLRQRQIEGHILADAAFVAKHGSIADEFNAL